MARLALCHHYFFHDLTHYICCMRLLFFASATLAITLFAFSCQNSSTPQVSTESSSAVEVPADFTTFYEHFHADSLFQVGHIVWPLQGLRLETLADSSASQVKPYYWTPETWVMHRPVDYSEGHYARELQMMGDLLIVERIRVKAVNYGIERRFARQPDTGEWAMIYYSDIQEM